MELSRSSENVNQYKFDYCYYDCNVYVYDLVILTNLPICLISNIGR